MKINKKKYKGYEIYYYKDKFLDISEKIVDKKYQMSKNI